MFEIFEILIFSCFCNYRIMDAYAYDTVPPLSREKVLKNDAKNKLICETPLLRVHVRLWVLTFQSVSKPGWFHSIETHSRIWCMPSPKMPRSNFWSLRRLFGGTYLNWKTGISGWEIKWFASFNLASFKKYGLWFEATQFLLSFKPAYSVAELNL